MQTALTVLVISAVHDYRMARRGSIQAIADAFKRAGHRTVFLSVRFSALSLMKGDPRAFLHARANRIEHKDGVECYLWRTPLHPFATGSERGNQLTTPLHDVYARWPSRDVDDLFRQADVAIVESGLGILLIPRIRRLNANARIVYRASDALNTIGAHPLLQQRLLQCDAMVEHYCLLAPDMAPQFRFAQDRTYVVGQALHKEDFAAIGANPYGGGRHAVCVGSMLFDHGFFDVAAAAFPEVTFHIIGCGMSYRGPSNVRVYPEMSFHDMLPYVAHADIGIAPYRNAPHAHYLADSSLKLVQFAYLRRPAVCPHFATGGKPHRFGYTPDHEAEINAAMARALADEFEADAPAPLTWDDVAPRLLNPSAFRDTALAPERFSVKAAARTLREPLAAG